MNAVTLRREVLMGQTDWDFSDPTGELEELSVSWMGDGTCLLVQRGEEGSRSRWVALKIDPGELVAALGRGGMALGT